MAEGAPVLFLHPSHHRSGRTPAGRVGSDEDIAGAAIYLCSRAGDYVVGGTLAVDGGVAFGKLGFEGDSWKD